MGRSTKPEVRALLECIKECYSICDVEPLRQRFRSRLSKLVETKARRFHEVGPPPVEKVCPSRAHRLDSPSKTDGFLNHRNHSFIYDETSRDLAHKQHRSVLRSTSQPTRNSGTTDFAGNKQISRKPPGFRRLKIQNNVLAIARLRRKIGLLEDALDALHIGLIVQSLDGNVRLVTRCAIRQLRNFLGRGALRGNSLSVAVFMWVKQQQLASVREGNVASPFVPLVLQQREKSLVIRCVTDSDQTSVLLEEKPAPPQPVRSCGLSKRETEVLDWVSQGRTNKEIGVILHLSPRTVQKHLEHVYRKLNVTTRTAAAGKLYNLFQHSGKQMSIFFFFSISSLMM